MIKHQVQNGTFTWNIRNEMLSPQVRKARIVRETGVSQEGRWTMFGKITAHLQR